MDNKDKKPKKPKKPKKEKKMALTWEVTIQPINVNEYIAAIVGVATDDSDPGNPITASVANAIIETQPQQVAALDILYEKYLTKLGKQTQVGAWLDGKEADAKSYLEAK